MRPRPALGTACALALAATAAAQTPPPQPPPAQPAAANLYPAALYRMADVSKSMTLTPEQVNRLNTLTDQVQAKYRDDYARLAAASAQDQAARLRELNRQYSTAWTTGAKDIFNEAQRTRYQQLTYQYGGFSTLYDPDLQTRLTLTPAQMKGLDAHWGWSAEQLQAIDRLGATDPTKAAQLYRDYWTARQERLNTFLTAEQRKVWQEMTGDPYTFQPTFTRRR